MVIFSTYVQEQFREHAIEKVSKNDTFFREMEGCQKIVESKQSKSDIFHEIENAALFP